VVAVTVSPECEINSREFADKGRKCNGFNGGGGGIEESAGGWVEGMVKILWDWRGS